MSLEQQTQSGEDVNLKKEEKDVDYNKKQHELLSNLSKELKNVDNLDKEKIVSIGEKLLLLWIKSMERNSSDKELFDAIHELFYLIDVVKELLPFTFLLTFQSAINIYLLRQKEILIKFEKSFDLLVPALNMMQFSLKIMEKYLNTNYKNTIQFDSKPGTESRLCLANIMTLSLIIDASRNQVNLWISFFQTDFKIDQLVQFFTLLMNKRVGPEICHSIIEILLCLASIRETANYFNKSTLISQINMIAVLAYERPYAHLSQLAATNSIGSKKMKSNEDSNPQLHHQQQQLTPLEQLQLPANTSMSDTAKIYLDNINSDHNWLPIYWHVIRLNISMVLTLDGECLTLAVEFLSIHCIRICEILELLRTKPRSVNMEEVLQIIYMINLVLKHGNMWLRKDKQSYIAISDEIAKTAYTLATSALPPPTTITNQQEDNHKQHTSIKPRDCLIYARCCYDFGKHTEAERVLFQTKFGDKDGFIKEASQIYGDKLSLQAFHLAALICLKTNRHQDAIDFALQVFADDCEYLDVVNAFTQNRP